MTANRYAVAPIVVAKARRAGPVGERWLRELPETVASLEAAWQVRVTAQLEGGTASFVARAVTAAGDDVVLKIAVPGLGLAPEARTLAAAQGNGYVRLLACDVARDAVLLEPLGSSLVQSGLPPMDQLAVLGALLLMAWQVPKDAETPVTDQAAILGAAILNFQQQLPGAAEDSVVEYALACARRRSAALNEQRCVRLHGDPAPANALRVIRPRPGTATGFVLVDPSSFTGDSAYDAGVALRDWCPQLLSADDPPALLRTYSEKLAAVTGIDAVAIWEWGFVERFSTGLYCLSLGDDERARPFLTTAAPLIGGRW